MTSINTTGKQVATCFLLAVAVLMFQSCKKNENQVNTLSGNWGEEIKPPTFGRTLNFGTSNISFIIWQYNEKETGNFTSIDGTYRIKGDSLITSFKEITVVKEKKIISREKFIGTLFDKATFKVQGNQLILNYLTYPADAPVTTQGVYNRIVTNK